MKFETIVIIPSFNGEKHLPECISSLRSQSYKKFKIIFVDDGSTDNSVDYVRNNFPNVEIMSNKANIGFTKSINKAIVYSIKNYSPKYISLLNNDTIVDSGWLKYLILAIESEGEIAAVASNMLFYDNPEIINSQGGSCNLIGIGKDVNFGIKKIEASFKKYVLAPCFGACLIKTEVLKHIGLPDERFFSYCEDLDWGWRANSLGYKVIFEKRAIVYHKFSSSWKNNELKKIYLGHRNALCTIIKNYEISKLIPALILTPFYDFAFFFAYLINMKMKNWSLERIRSNLGLLKRIKYGVQPFLGILWNIKELRNTLSLRKRAGSRAIL